LNNKPVLSGTVERDLPTGSVSFRSKRLGSDLALLGAAVIWGSTFVVQRVAATQVGPFLYNGLRFLLGAAVLLPFVLVQGTRTTRTERRGGALAGMVLVGAAVLQQAGLQYTTAGKAAFVTGLYVVLVPLFLAAVWRQWPRRIVWLASLLAAAGLYLLSATGPWALGPGDGLELAGAALWAMHVILIGRLVEKADALRLALVQYAVCGAVSTALGLVLEFDMLSGLSMAWGSVLYGGVVAVGMGYTLQVIGQKGAPAADAALLLSLEAVFAALFGWWFLGELLTPRQLLGCGLMLGGMLLAQLNAGEGER
jgi:drug/metabolite transporter (DMT)-like permease